MTTSGVYVGNSSGDVDYFESWLGNPVDFTTMFLNQNSWAAFEESIPWATDIWKDTGRDVHWSVPLTTWYDGNLDDAAAGQYNNHYLNAAEAIAATTAGTGPIYIRTGWEMNGTWFPWSAEGHEEAFISAWRQFVDTFRSVSDRFQFEWTPNVGNDWFQHPADAYPGNDYVDQIGMDFYWNTSWMGTDPLAVWDWLVSQSGGLQWQVDFAAAHGKQVAYSEWGANSPDAAAFFDRAAAWFNQNGAAYQSYWNYGDDGYSSQLDRGLYPAAGAEYINDFGLPSQAPLSGQSPYPTFLIGDTEDHVINIAEAKAVLFTVADLRSDESAVATFSDGAHVQTKRISANGVNFVDLSGFDGVVTAVLTVTSSTGARTIKGKQTFFDTNAPVAVARSLQVTDNATSADSDGQTPTLQLAGTLSRLLSPGEQVWISYADFETTASVNGLNFTAQLATVTPAGTIDVSIADAAGNRGLAKTVEYDFAGGSADTLILRVSADSYQGSPHFDVLVDGQRVGATQTAIASHAAGQTQDITLTGQFGSGAHAITVTFLDDLYGGTAASDRNLYVHQVSFNGQIMLGDTANNAAGYNSNGVANMFNKGSAIFHSAGAAPSSDTVLQLLVSADSYQGDPHFKVLVDGQQIGETLTTAASHAAGQTQDITLTGQFSAGAHEVSVWFVDDLYGGAASSDRNLYVHQVSFNGHTMTGDLASNNAGYNSNGVANIYDNGSATWRF